MTIKEFINNLLSECISSNKNFIRSELENLKVRINMEEYYIITIYSFLNNKIEYKKCFNTKFCLFSYLEKEFFSDISKIVKLITNME